MANSHAVADFASELQATCEDLLPACVISTTWPTVPASSLTLAAFATQAYVRDLQNLIYVDQPAVTVTLGSAAGAWWVAVSRDTFTAYSGWTRRSGSHYLFQASVSRPADVDGLLVAIQVTVAGGIITAVTPAPGVTRAERWRALGGLGTMAQQDANAVAITGGSATGLGVVSSLGFVAPNSAGDNRAALTGQVEAAGGTERYNLHMYGTAPNFLAGRLMLGDKLGVVNTRLSIRYQKAAFNYGLTLQVTDNDAENGAPVIFVNVAGTPTGQISTTATTTAYGTTSDARLKHAITDLTGELALIKALRPVAFRWRSDDSPGVGFLASEVAALVQGVITGDADAVEEDGRIRPQMIDMSKLTPWVVGACKTLAAQVESLTARIAVLEDALGI